MGPDRSHDRARSGYGQGRGFLVEPEFPPHQKKVGQQAQGHVVMLTDPAASFVVS